MESKLTFSERLHRAVGSQTIEDYKARHAYLHAMCYAREEFDTIWLDSANTTWAHWFGRMIGFDEVYLNSVTHSDGMAIEGRNNLIRKHHKEYRGHDLRSTGVSFLHILASDVIEVAEDGQSIRAAYLTPGILTSVGGHDDSRSGEWIYERYGSEFVYIDGEWRWFHEQVCPDITGTFDADNWAYDGFTAYMKRRASPNGDDMEWPPPQFLTEPASLHFPQSIVQTVQNTLPPPEPYMTLDDAHSYSPGRTDPTVKETNYPDRSLPKKKG